VPTPRTKPSLWVIGSENPRIRDFFNEVGRWMDVTYLDIEKIGYTLSFDRIVDSWRWRRRARGFPEARICVPYRWQTFSASLSHWFCRRRFAQVGRPDAMVFTWPRLSVLCEMIPDVFRIYYCKDPFTLWPGDSERVLAHENRMLRHCDAAFAVSRQLVDDMTPRARGPVYYLPNAVTDSFVRAGPQDRPDDLPVGRPIIGCVGQINNSYDWQYIRELTAAVPEALFCFVGQFTNVNALDRRRIQAQLRATPNMRFLGYRPHQRLIAYMRHFDICFNFLRLNENNHRRSPLRLFDYLATDRPVLSTPVREAFEQLPHVVIAPTPREAADTIREILQGRLKVDLAARRQYIQQNTWSTRAAQFMQQLRECGFNSGSTSRAA
jgi:Glycosyl transferases group 1